MIKTRLASAAAVFTFGLAALGGTALAIAEPANAETVTSSTSGSMSTSGTASTSDTSGQVVAGPGSTVTSGNKSEPKRHEPFPHQPHSPHQGQGKKGRNEPHAHPPRIWPAPKIWSGVDETATG